MLGCDATTEALVSTMENRDINRFYILESSSCCMRTFCEHIHPFTMDFSIGGDKGGPIISQFERPLRFPAHNCKCCCFQEISVVENASKQLIGKTMVMIYVLYALELLLEFILLIPHFIKFSTGRKLPQSADRNLMFMTL
jgi:hypothetical protein